MKKNTNFIENWNSEIQIVFPYISPQMHAFRQRKRKKLPGGFVIIPLKTKHPLSQMILVLNRLLRATVFFIYS